MSLNAYVAQVRNTLFSELTAGLEPTQGLFDAAVFANARVKGKPQVGTTRFSPYEISLEFIYPDRNAASVVFTVRVPAPERIVFMPVPTWVIESIWQGEIDGSHQFESDAMRLLREFGELLSLENNKELFGPKQAARRE